MTKTKNRRPQSAATGSLQRARNEPRARKAKRSGGVDPVKKKKTSRTSSARGESKASGPLVEEASTGVDDSQVELSDKKTSRVRGESTREQEPTQEEMAKEEVILDEAGGIIGTTPRSAKGRARAKAKEKNLPAAGKDLLASYMDQLSKIPLFTPEEEQENARKLEELELISWTLVLYRPRAVEHVLAESRELDESVQKKVEKLLESYRRAASRSKSRKVASHPARDKLIQAVSRVLRVADYDKEMLERVLVRLRKEAWGRRVIDATPAFRLTHADLTDIEQARGQARRARNDFVRANLRLVVSVARNFHHYRIPFIDLIQEGNVGLMKAVHRFDHERGFRFSTYAHWWIRQSIERAIINKGSQVRLPVHVIDSRRQVGRATAKLTQSLGRSPTPDEISRHIKMPKAKVEQILNGVQQDPVSLDESVSHDDPRKFLDLVRDHSQPALDEALIRENTHDRVRELLQLLNPIEKDIIRRRFGLGDDSDQTLDQIGKIYNLSRERVRQIQAQGLQKMRRMCERRQIS